MSDGRDRVRQRSNAVLVYVLLLVSLQIFLLVVAVEAFMADEATLAWPAAVWSVVLFVAGLGFLWFLRDD